MKPFKQHKYKARPTGGYASKREAEYADLLRRSKEAGAIEDWLEQVPIRLPGGVKYVVDFLVINADGTVRFVEIKGMATPAWKIKHRTLQETRPWVFSRLEVLR
jgi:hypothetical protein